MGLMDIDQIIDMIKERSRLDIYYNPQFSFRGSAEQKKDFQTYLCDTAEVKWVDILKSIQREYSDMKVDQVIEMIEDDTFMGIKVVYKPITTFSKWDRWEDGYIEGYLRTMTSPDYFIWTYHKMGKLKSLLSDFPDLKLLG